MSKFLKVTLWLFGGFIGTIVLSALLLTPDTRAREDPAMTQINACAKHYERFFNPVNESVKSELLWWCTRNHYGLNR
jgi:hypothetical protein